MVMDMAVHLKSTQFTTKSTFLEVLHEKFISLQSAEDIQASSRGIFTKPLSNLLGNLIGCEVVSSMILKNRLPLHQWTHVDVSVFETNLESRSKVECPWL